MGALIRKLSDKLCAEHGLSIIFPGSQRGKKYKEWQAGRNGTAWKEQLKVDIDEAIKNAATYGDCIELIRSKGYEVKGEAIGTANGSNEEKAHKFISFRPLDRERFVRGSAKSLGTDYTKERIKDPLLCRIRISDILIGTGLNGRNLFCPVILLLQH